VEQVARKAGARRVPRGKNLGSEGDAVSPLPGRRLGGVRDAQISRGLLPLKRYDLSTADLEGASLQSLGLSSLPPSLLSSLKK